MKATLILCSLWLALFWPAGRLLAYRDLETGTFLTRDPAGMVDGPNVYAYVRQNPWTHFDPEGLMPDALVGEDGRAVADMTMRGVGKFVNEHPRTMGVVKAVGSTGEMAVGIAGAMAPTGVTQVLGGAAIAHGSDGFQAGLRQAWNGTPTETFTQQAIAGVAEKSGASPATAQTIGAAGDGLLSVGLTLGVSVTTAPIKSAATVSLETGNAVEKVSTGAESANAGAALNTKLSALQDAQESAASTSTLPDGRVRYYGPETPARTSGPTRGAAYVTEHNPATGQVRSWMESYNQTGDVNRVHPKMINGQSVNSQHYPPTAKELGK